MRVVSESRSTRQAQRKSERVRERARWKCNDRSNELKKARAKKVHGEREWCESGTVHRAGTSMIRREREAVAEVKAAAVVVRIEIAR